MYEDLFTQAKSGSNRSELFDQLDPEQKADVLEFVEWLHTTDMATSSVSSYKSYVTKAMLKADGKIDGELTNDEKSGVRKFAAWFATKPVDED
jgi:hypothetical protein